MKKSSLGIAKMCRRLCLKIGQSFPDVLYDFAQKMFTEASVSMIYKTHNLKFL